jgi:hypothetical protein
VYIHAVPTHDGKPVAVSHATPQAPQLLGVSSGPQPESTSVLPLSGPPDELPDDPLVEPLDEPLDDDPLAEPLDDPLAEPLEEPLDDALSMSPFPASNVPVSVRDRCESGS